MNNIIDFYGIVFSSSVCILLMQLLCLTEMLQIIPKPLHLEWKENIIKWRVIILTSGMMKIKMVKTECLALAFPSKVSFQ